MKFKLDQFEINLLHGPSILSMFQLKYYYSYFPVKQKTGKKHKKLTSQSGQHPNNIKVNHFSEKCPFRRALVLYILPKFLA